MNRTAAQWLGRTFAVVAAALVLNGCVDESPLGPDAEPLSPELNEVGVVAAGGAMGAGRKAPGHGVCDNLRVPAGHRFSLRLYAAGVQIYRWDGATWVFQAPLAELTVDRRGRIEVGTHYAGPTWESRSGSKVVGAVVERCTPDPAHVPWLLLEAVSNEGHGIFRRVTYIQRVNTAGGNAPATPGTAVGQEARVPYTTEYLFYRAK